MNDYYGAEALIGKAVVPKNTPIMQPHAEVQPHAAITSAIEVNGAGPNTGSTSSIRQLPRLPLLADCSSVVQEVRVELQRFTLHYSGVSVYGRIRVRAALNLISVADAGYTEAPTL